MKKYFSALIILGSLLLNFSAKAIHADDIFYFDKNTNVASSEILTSPSSEAPAPVVTIYYPRVDFSSGKSKPVIFEGSKDLNNSFQTIFSSLQFFSGGKFFQIPVYLMNGVFRI